MIYHMPGQRYYDRTTPEACFASQDDARAAGYRKAKV
ncbi:sunset domain-containing protein [Mobiluncus curtisii]